VPSSEAVRRALEPSAEELYEDAPCGYLSMLQDGTLAKVNRTLLRSMGYAPEELLGRRLHDLLAPGSRIYHETHWGPRLALEGEVREVPVDLVRADGTRLTALLNAVLTRTAEGHPSVIRASVFDATDRRRYERELVASRDVERDARRQSERLLAVLKTRSALQSAVVGLSTRALEGIALADLLEEATARCAKALGAGHVSVVTDGSEASEVPSVPRPGRADRSALAVLRPPAGRTGGRRSVLRGRSRVPGRRRHRPGQRMERRRIEDATRHLALHDALTGCPTARSSMPTCRSRSRRQRRPAGARSRSACSISTTSSSSTTPSATPRGHPAPGGRRPARSGACGRRTPWPGWAATSSSSSRGT
jgi:PAS domain S-box-containing protein